MKRLLGYLTLLFLVLLAAPVLSALDLPVKTIKGKQYYYYIVKKGDTLYSLVNRLGVTRSALVASNPSAADILREGQTLYFAVDEFGNGETVDAPAEENTQTQAMESGVILHKVKKGETLYGISRHYDVDPETVVALNPRARNGVKTGETLRIPSGEPSVAENNTDKSDEPLEEQVIATGFEVTADLTPVRPSIGLVEQTQEDPVEEKTAPDDSVTVVETHEGSVAIILPFMLESENPGKQAMLYTDFYKGFLLAADTLSNRGDSLKIYAYDTMGDLSRVKALMENEDVKNASVIIAPDDEAQLAAIAETCGTTGTKVINVFNVKDSLYAVRSNMVQINIPHRVMYAKAMQAVDRYFADYKPVILKNVSGKNDKMEFISYMTDVCQSRGIEPMVIEYDGALISSQLEALANDGGRYLLIPASGSLNEFNKFIHAVKTVRDAAADASDIAVFGYPDWTAFRGDAEEMLHAVDAVVYSRFYYDAKSFDTRSLSQAFERWYGCEPIQVVPNQGVLGFDVGNMVLRNLRANDGVFDPSNCDYRGVQSSFRFAQPSENGGYYNDEIYILRFKPYGRVERMDL